MNYSTPFIDGDSIQFIGYELLGIIPFPLLVEIRFGLWDMGSLGFSRYRPLGGMSWIPVLGLRHKSDRFTGLAYKSSFNHVSRT